MKQKVIYEMLPLSEIVVLKVVSCLDGSFLMLRVVSDHDL